MKQNHKLIREDIIFKFLKDADLKFPTNLEKQGTKLSPIYHG